VNQQALKMIDLNNAGSPLNSFENFAEHLAPFIYGKERLLVGVHQDGDDDFVEEFAASLDDVEVTVCNWIE
jgi:hypothetical protein